MNRYELNYLPSFNKNTKLESKKVNVNLPQRTIRFDDRTIFPFFQKPPPLPFSDNRLPEPLEIKIKDVDTDIWKKVEDLLGKSIDEKIKGMEEIAINPGEEKQKEQAIAAINLNLLDTVEDLTDKQIEKIAESTTELKINESPLDEGLIEIIDNDFLKQNPGSKQKIALWILSQAKKTNTNILRPIIGVQGFPIRIQNVFANLANPKFDHSLNLIEGKMIRNKKADEKEKEESELDLSLPNFGLSLPTQT